MKKYVLFWTLLISVSVGRAQPRIDTADAGSLDDDYIMISEKNEKWYREWSNDRFKIYSKKHYLNSPGEDKRTVISYYGNASLTRSVDCDTLELASTLITPQNAHRYMYHVILNDSIELVPWSKPAVFMQSKKTIYAYLGKFASLSKIIKVEMYEVGNYKDKAILIFNSGYKPAPKLKWVGVFENDKDLFVPDRQIYIPYKKQHYYQPEEWAKKGIKIQWSDNLNHIAVSMKNTLQNDLYHVYLKRAINDKTDTVFVTANWEMDYHRPDPIARINSAYFNKPGNYEIIVVPEIPKDDGKKESAVVQFTVTPGPTTVPLRTVIFIILIILSIAIRTYFYLRRKQKIATQAKEIATLQLQSVRSQLNPHFIFNALAGIQNLMNKNEVENANKYLARFARLTRNVLDEGQKELIPIANEVSLLTDYLEMEQMRFGFKFSINVGEGVDQQIEIPAMLLQPFAENAVKHGISALKEDGNITVGINQISNDITLTVSDNGPGFSKTLSPGMGIKLCEERIRLLNTVYKNTPILLHINPTDKGTTVTIELKNWL